MSSWIFRRLFQAAGLMAVMSLLVFVAVNVIGNPVEILIAQDADQADRQRAIEALGLDRPLWEQYLNFVQGALQGDLGNSFVFGKPALDLIWERFPATLELAVLAVILSAFIGVPLGVIAGLRPGSWFSRMIMTGSILGFSLPTFWVGLMSVLIFSVYLGILPSGGRGETVEIAGVGWSFLTWDGLKHLFLPAFNLSLFSLALILRLTRAGVQDVLPQDFVRFARAKGLRPRRIVLVHILKSVMIPVVTVMGLEFGSVMAFAVVTETIFSWPGMGRLIIESINVLDRPVIVAYLMVITFIFVVTNLLVDLSYMYLDPRSRGEDGS